MGSVAFQSERHGSLSRNQGYLWDTQTDMFLCLVGSILALLALTKLHDRYLLKMQSPQNNHPGARKTKNRRDDEN